MCGDEHWFADESIRQELQQKVIAAHAEQKISVGPPADEIRRIWPGGGRVLGAGAVLRLGGAHLGGYGEGDVSYAYRQLSRALHPDKNQGIAEAGDAFKRLSEAADELREGLKESRVHLKTFCEAMGGTVTPAMSERPQEALFAEASRILSGVLGLSGEGSVPEHMMSRAAQVFAHSSKYYNCEARVLLSLWYESPNLLVSFTSIPVRIAYDGSPKHLRAQFLCALNRVAICEEKRYGGLRGPWQGVLAQFPEMGLWRDLRDKLKARSIEKASKWDQGAEKGAPASSWAAPLRDRIREMLAVGVDEVVQTCMPEPRNFATEIWKEVATWARGEGDAQRHLDLFTAEPGGRVADWAFVPASDLFVVIAEGMMGMTAEGFFLEALVGVQPPPVSDVKDDSKPEPPPPLDEVGGQKEREEGMMMTQEEQLKAQGKDFDWEQIWRQKNQVSKFRSGQGYGQSQGGRKGRRSSSSRSRGRRRAPARNARRGGRSRSRSRRRSPSRRNGRSPPRKNGRSSRGRGRSRS